MLFVYRWYSFILALCI